MAGNAVELFSGVLPFVRVAEELSFRRAAERLGVSTAAVSKAVGKLEADLGVRLLQRTSRRVTLTREGTLFLERCRGAVAAVTGARELMSASRRQPQGRVTLSAPFILAPLLLPGLAELLARYALLSVRLEFSDRLANLAAGDADVAVRMGALESSSLRARLLRRTRWVTLASPAYLASHGVPARPADLANHACVRFVAPNGRPRHWSFASGLTLPIAGRLDVDRGEFLIAAAEAGLGVCQVLDFMVGEGAQPQKLTEILKDFAAEGPRIHAVTLAGRAASSNVRAVVDVLAQSFRQKSGALGAVPG
jgi:LysR family transcriptional regulator, regulator for bpeEF and oprC